MKIQVETDSNIEGHATLKAKVEAAVAQSLERYTRQVTRVEVHLSDVNGAKYGDDDRRCLMEARLAGRPPLAVKHQAATLELAWQGAVEKLERALASSIGKLRAR